MNDEMTPLPADDPMMQAFDAYMKSEEFANTRKWALHEAYVDGSLWAAFCAGWNVAVTAPPEERRESHGEV